jgi:hypothetical protein
MGRTGEGPVLTYFKVLYPIKTDKNQENLCHYSRHPGEIRNVYLTSTECDKL